MSTDTPDGDRIAKVLSRAGVASRRDAERMISEGRVKVNGKPVTSPALNVLPSDRILVDGKPVDPPEPTRLWLYHKPAGLVTSDNDELGRATVFEQLPEGMPRVMSVGRLDLTSEGLLILTNDGEVKRKLELPATGWLRRYRVRINGSVSEDKLDELRRGITVDGVDYQPMDVTFDRQQGANAWLTIAIREGKNREIRRVMEALGVTVNRLIRTSYGPFQLGNLAAGAVEELPRRQVRDQLGLIDPDEDGPSKPAQGRKPGPKSARPAGPVMRSTKGPRPGEDAPRPARSAAAKPARSAVPRLVDEDRPPRPRTPRPVAEADRPKTGGPRKPYAPRAGQDERPQSAGGKSFGYRSHAAEQSPRPRGPAPAADGERPRSPAYKPRGDDDRPARPMAKVPPPDPKPMPPALRHRATVPPSPGALTATNVPRQRPIPGPTRPARQKTDHALPEALPSRAPIRAQSAMDPRPKAAPAQPAGRTAAPGPQFPSPRRAPAVTAMRRANPMLPAPMAPASLTAPALTGPSGPKAPMETTGRRARGPAGGKTARNNPCRSGLQMM
jgi:23S rRNA pseudouridine2605 synthase